MEAAASPRTLTWKPMHGGYRGVSEDGLREYWVQPAIKGWWSVTTSVDVTVRKLIRSLEGAVQLADKWEAHPGLLFPE
jgi:hypothetical protein